MSDLVVIAFPSEAKAEEVRHKILDLQKDYLIELGDAVIAVKQPNGTVKLNQLINTTAMGAVSGAFWGTLIGLIFLMPLAGDRRGFRRPWRRAHRRRHKRCLHEGSRGNLAVRQCGAVFADPQAYDRQSAGRFERRWRDGVANLFRSYE
jgi:hypothetical protein